MESIAKIGDLVGVTDAADRRSWQEQLVAACLDGDPAAAEEMVREFSPLVFGIGLRLTGRPEDAEDLAQEVFLRIFRSLKTFRGDCSLRSWVAAVAVNAARNRVGGLVRRRRVIADSPASRDRDTGDPMMEIPDRGGHGPEQRLLARERRQLLAQAIRSLPQEFREVLILRDQQGLSYEEIADAAGIPIGTVRSRLARGRAMVVRQARRWLGLSAIGGET